MWQTVCFIGIGRYGCLKKRLLFFALLFAVVLFGKLGQPICVFAEQELPESVIIDAENNLSSEELLEEDTQTFLENIDTKDVDILLQDALKEDVSFTEMVRQLISGDMPFNGDTIWAIIKSAFLSEIGQNKDMMVALLLVTVIAALFTNFTNLLEKSGVADVGFYILYLLLITILFQSFSTVEELSSQVLSQMTEFMKLLLPAFFLAVVAVKGGTTAVVFYELILVVIYIVELVLLKVLLPMCSIYVMVSLVNQVSKEDFFSKMAALIRQIILWVLKTMFAVVTGINIVNSLLSPAIDNVKNGTLRKALSSIPGIGNTLGSMSDVMLGSGVLIKNGVGVCVLIVLVMLCLIPVVKLFVCMLLYKVTGVVVQPVSDKRISNCIETVADGTWLLMKCVITTMTLFFVTMAIVTVASG